jgi:hypothetical protein
MKKMTLFIVIAGINLGASITAYAQSFELFYQRESYECSMTSFKNSFKIEVNNARKNNFYSIQVFSRDIATIKDTGEYILKFKANTSKEFTMYSRFGAEDVNSFQYFKDKPSAFLAGESEYYIPFNVKNVIQKAVLYFQFGYADAGTTVEISNIEIILKNVETDKKIDTSN